MFENFVTAFIIYFVVIDSIGNAPVSLAITSYLDQRRKLRVAVEGSAIATAIMLFFALCGAWVLAYLQISEEAFKIAGGIILFLVALDMLAAKRQQRKQEKSISDQQPSKFKPENNNPAIHPLAFPLFARPAATMSVFGVIATKAQ